MKRMKRLILKRRYQTWEFEKLHQCYINGPAEVQPFQEYENKYFEREIVNFYSLLHQIHPGNKTSSMQIDPDLRQ